MGKNLYLSLICQTLVEEYGDTLVEGGTDLRMAKKLFEKLKPYLKINKEDISKKDFNNWRKKFKAEIMGLELEDMTDEDY